MSTSPSQNNQTLHDLSSTSQHQLQTLQHETSFQNANHDPDVESSRRRNRMCQASRTPARPDPWIQRKFAILIVIALGVWPFYVVVGRACTPMIRNQSSSGLGRSVGVGTLLGFVPIWLMGVWSYMKIILTGPGFATKAIPNSPPPEHYPSTDYIPFQMPIGADPPVVTDDSAPDPSEFAPLAGAIAPGILRVSSNGKSRSRVDILRPVPRIDTAPRWCRFCEIIKPDRTHHCRHCGKCVLQFDHHCLWIGQCVGWANHKFFMIFNLWACLYYMYIFIFLIIAATRMPTPDGQIIALTAVSALFGLFTCAMLTTHIHLILTGRTTVESFAGRDQHEQEAAILQKEFGYLWRNQEKRQVRRRWREEWGGTPVDARWRHGSMRQMWEQEMGEKVLGWIIPIGLPLGDGIHFPSNPRFGPHGEWLRRKDWPKDML